MTRLSVDPSVLHPVARQLLEAFALTNYFRSVRLCQALAERDPAGCLYWAAELLAPTIAASTPHEVVTETLRVVRSQIDSPDPDCLPLLDELAWNCWSSGSFDMDSPFLQRAVARLAWAAIGLVCVVTSSSFRSERVAVAASVSDGTGMATLVHQCASAIDMIHTGSQDGRLMVAADFTRRMKSLES